MSRFLISVGAILACLLAALFFLPQFVEWNHYRSIFEDEASRLLGRDVRVGGEVNLRLLPTPYIRFDRVRVAETRGGGGEPLLKADEFTIRLAVAPLFRGAIEATHVELARPVLTLVADNKGGGNWNSLGASTPRSIFVPRSVALHDVRIVDGAVILKDATGEELSRFEAQTAEFSAVGLDGPYKLQAALKSPTGQREVRLSTAKPEPDGSVRFKGTLRALDHGPSYTIDGQLVDLTGRTRVTGDLTASLPLPDDGSASKSRSARSDGPNAFNLRAALRADTEGVQFSDLSLSFDSGGQPQLATGEARFHWRDDQTARIRLESRWLDLDRIASGTAEHSPIGQVARLAAAVDRLIPNAGQTQAAFTLDQATLGGEVVSGLRLTLDKTAGGLRLRELRASLPGGTRLETSGTMNPAKSDGSFDGDMTLRGASLNRFLGWAGKGQALPELKHDGSFAMRGSVTIGSDRIAGRGMMLQLAGNALLGEVGWNGETRQLTIAVEASELALSPLLHGELRPSALIASLLSRQEAGNRTGAPRKDAAVGAPPIQSTVRVRAGRLVVDTLAFRDVVADVDVDGDSVRVHQLKFTSEDGLAAQLRGTVTGLAGNTPKGSLGGDVSATQGASLRRFLEMLGIPEPLQPSQRRADALAPFRLGGTASIGVRGTSALDLSVDGMLGGSRLNARLLSDDPRLPWRQQRVDLTASLENAEISSLLAQLLPELLAAASEKGARTPARAMIKAVGTPARGLASLVAIDGPGTTGEFRGRLAVDDTASLAVEGEFRATAEDIGHAGSLVGLGRHPSLTGLPVQLVLGTKLAKNRLRFDASKAALGPVNILGQLDVDLAGARPRAEGRMRVGEVSLPRLTALVAESRSGLRDPAAAQGDGRTSLWPEGALDLSSIANIDAKIRLETPSLTLAPGIALSGAVMDAELDNGQLGIKLLEARALGGAATGELTIERVAAGANLRGKAQLTNASLEAMTAADKPAAAGEFALRLDFSSVGLSPRGLVAALRGKGSLTLGSARLNRMSPAAINTAALAALAAPGENLAAELRRRLEEGLGAGAIALGPREVALDIADGVVRAEPVSLETPDGRVTASTTVDLESLSFDSEWRVEPKPASGRAAPGKGSLPGVTLVYVGRLAQLAAAEPRLQSEALERELSVRKMERYVEELERLRRQDEERVRHEADRLRNQELERQRREDEQRALRKSSVDPSARTAPASAPAAKAWSTTVDTVRDTARPSH